MELPSLVGCLPLFVLHVQDGALCTPLQSIAVLEFGTSCPLTDSFREAECPLRTLSGSPAASVSWMSIAGHFQHRLSSQLFLTSFFAFSAIFPTTPQQHPLLPMPSAPNLCVPPGLIVTSAVRCLLLLPLPSLLPAALQTQLSTCGLCGPPCLLLPPLHSCMDSGALTAWWLICLLVVYIFFQWDNKPDRSFSLIVFPKPLLPIHSTNMYWEPECQAFCWVL